MRNQDSSIGNQNSSIEKLTPAVQHCIVHPVVQYSVITFPK